MSDLIECYECGTKVHQLSSRSRCVECEHRRAIVNEDYNEKLHNRIAELERERDEWKGRAEIATYQILFGTDTDKATMNSMREQLTKRDLEQKIKGVSEYIATLDRNLPEKVYLTTVEKDAAMFCDVLRKGGKQ